jgi:hypothetical protein
MFVKTTYFKSELVNYISSYISACTSNCLKYIIVFEIAIGFLTFFTCLQAFGFESVILFKIQV